MFNKKPTAIILLFLLMSFVVLHAGTTGKIAGSVVDANTGEPLIGANIVLEGTNLGAATDVDGYFVILNVSPDAYKLTVFYVGYKETTLNNVRVSVDRTTTLEIKMTSAAIEGETVTVEAERAAIELDRTHSSSVVTSETVDLLPVTEIEEIIQLQSGVVSSGGQLHFRGGRAREVSYVVDGVAVNNSFAQNGGSLVEVDNNMVAELEVITGTFNAEYGQAQSGVVNIVTRRPAAKFSGNVEYYAGDWLSNKTNIYSEVNNFDVVAEQNVQFSLTGPILSDKLGFFITGRYNNSESVQWYQRRFSSEDGWRIAAYREWAKDNIQAGGVIRVPDSLVTGDGSTGPAVTSDYGSLQAKLTFSVTPKITVAYTGFGSYRESHGSTARVNVFSPDNRQTTQDWRYSHFLRFQHFPSDNFFYNFAASYQRDDGDSYFRKDNKIAQFPGDDGIMVSPFTITTTNLSGGTQFNIGGTSGLYTNAEGRNYVDKYAFQGDFNWQVDKINLIKAGFSVTQHYYDIYNRGFQLTSAWENNDWPLDNFVNPRGMSFDDYWSSLNLYWRNWETIFDTTRVREVGRDEVESYSDYSNKPFEMAFYLQDKLELGSDIILNAGVRYDYFNANEKVPANYRAEASLVGSEQNLVQSTVKSQFSPRFAISFPISSQGAFRASYGHFFQMPPHGRMFNQPLVSLSPIDLEDRLLGNADLEPEKTVAYEIGLQQGIGTSIAVNISAYYKDFRNLLGIEQVQTVDGVKYTRFVNRDYGLSKGIVVDVTKRSGNFNGGMNYTMAYTNGSNSDPTELFLVNATPSVTGATEVFVDRQVAPLDWDQRHTFNCYVNFVKPNNWSVGITGFLDSNTPFSPDFLENFGLNEREFRNSANKPLSWSIDLKAKKNLNIAGLKSVLFFKVDNIFDHLNAENVFAASGKADENARLPEITLVMEGEIESEGVISFQEADLRPDFFSAPRKVQVGFEFKF